MGRRSKDRFAIMSDRSNVTAPIIALVLAVASLAVLGCRGMLKTSDSKATDAAAPPNVTVVARAIPAIYATASSRSETATFSLG